MPARPSSKDIDAYIAAFPAGTREALEQVRSTIREMAPDAIETISYAIPTFDLAGSHLVHFAGFARHVGFYPTPEGMKAFDAELARYKRGKGSVQFPLTEPMPLDLVRRIVEHRITEVTGAGS